MDYRALLRRALALAAAVVMATCGTLDRFDVDTTASAQIAEGTLTDKLLGLVSFAGFDEIDFSKDIENQGVTEDQIDSVKMKRLVLHTGASGHTLDFIERVDFYVEAEGLPRVLVATAEGFEGETSVELDLPDEELKPYVVAPFMTFDAEVQGQRPDQDTKITADVTLTIDATIPGCE